MKRLVRRLWALGTAVLALGAAPLAQSSTDVVLDLMDGNVTTYSERQFLRYETDYSGDGLLERIQLRSRAFGDDILRVGLVRVEGTLFMGLPVYFGLASYRDPVTDTRFSGYIIAALTPSGAPGDPDRLVFIMVEPGGVVVDSGYMTLPEAPPLPVPAPQNPFLADSIGPIGHLNSAQTDSIHLPGPLGPSETLGGAALSYDFMGPAHFGLAISPIYPGTQRRVYWSNGGQRIVKLDYDTLEVIAELEINPPAMAEAESENRIATLDALSGEALALGALPLAVEELLGLAGVYYLLDADNTLFVGGSQSILAYGDVVSGWVQSPIELKAEWTKPAEVGGNFVGANMTFDGKLCMVTDEGWIVIVERDFSDWTAIELPGNEIAPAHNAQMIAEGRRPGSASWVRNSVAIDQDGGIYVPSLEHMHKVIWDGTDLSIDPADGAWVEPFLNGRGIGTGATPSLMGFGDEDQFVVITDGEDLMNVLIYWRNDIPVGWTAPAGAPSSRIAGQLPADFNDPTLTAVQSEQSVIVGGYGAAVVNNEPPTAPPAGFPPLATTLLAGYAGNDVLYAPMGIQKMEWNPDTQTFEDAWVQPNVSSANSVPIVSTRSNLLYTVGGRDGEWSMEAVDWQDGSSAFHFITGSQRYNTRFSGLFLDNEGRIVHTTTYGIMRYER